MAQQTDLFPPNPRSDREGENDAGSLPASRYAHTRGSAEQRVFARPHGTPLPQRISWMARLEVIVRILVRLYLGLLVTALPWLTFWTQNNLFTYDVTVLTLASSGFVRGMVSGLGLLNIFLAIMEAKDARELR